MLNRQVKNKQTKVFVAMSGGVDSSVAAALLKEQGYNVTGVFFKPWQPNSPAGSLVHCSWQEDRQDALRVAVKLKIPLLTWDFSDTYNKKVVQYMINSYKKGITPNPDVMCNSQIKFGVFLKHALEAGADYIATGHYVRLQREITNYNFSRFFQNRGSSIALQSGQISNKSQALIFKLLAGKDKDKDQSYFLWTLTQKQLKHCLFPIGDYIKGEVRKLAKKFNLPNWDKKDSQGVCFVGDLNMADFLKEYIPSQRGKVLDASNNIIGEHEGAEYYTIGQRHGFTILNGKDPYYVIKKDEKKNLIYVGSEDDLKSNKAKITNINWVGESLKLPAKIEIKIRYGSKPEKAVLLKNGDLKFKNSIRAVTPGQSAVFYAGDKLLGGGVIR